jgi:hypothetical protein
MSPMDNCGCPGCSLPLDWMSPGYVARKIQSFVTSVNWKP